MSGDLYDGARDDPTPHILSQFEAPMDSNELVSFLDCPPVMYNGIGLTTPRGRYVPRLYSRVTPSQHLAHLSVVPMATSFAISPSYGPVTPKTTVLMLGMLPHQNIGNPTRRYSNMKEKGR